MECGDFSEFQETLKNMRKVDDIIVNTINTVIPTDSFHQDSTHACKDLHAQIADGNNKREKVIKSCITLTAERVRKLREKRESEANDVSLAKNLRDEQTKLRMLQVELSVEELVKQRTAKVFSERCRQYFKPE